MSNKPSRDINRPKAKTLLNFPERFPIKAFGLDDACFRAGVKTIIEAHVVPEHCLSWREAQSAKGSYLAITVTIMAQSQTQLDSIYIALTRHEAVKMAL